jgi:hypothetical protein
MKTKKIRKQGNPDPVILADIVQRVVEAAAPEKIVLFGSAARGTMGSDSQPFQHESSASSRRRAVE